MAWARVATVDENWAPLQRVEVECFDVDTLKPIKVVSTDKGGIALFTGLPENQRYFFKVRVQRVSTGVQSTLDPSRSRTYTGVVRLQILAMSAGATCYDALVDPNGHGAYTTIQAAIDAYSLPPGVNRPWYIAVVPGTYTEDLVFTQARRYALHGCAQTMSTPFDCEGEFKAGMESIHPSGVEIVGSITQTGAGAGELSLRGIYIRTTSAVWTIYVTYTALRIENCFVGSGTTGALRLGTSCGAEVINSQIGHDILKMSLQLTLAAAFVAINSVFLGWFDGTSQLGLRLDACVVRANRASNAIVELGALGQTAESAFRILNSYIDQENATGNGILLKGTVTPDVEHGFQILNNYIDGNGGGTGVICENDIEGAIIVGNTFNGWATGINAGGAPNVISWPNLFAGNVTTPTSGGGGPGTVLTPYHTLLDATFHTDTVAQAVSVGSLIYGNATPKWDELVISVPAANVRNVLGIDNAETLPSWKAALDGTNPADIAAAAGPGTSLIFSHRDHVHKHPAGLGADLHHVAFVKADADLLYEALGAVATHAALTTGVHGVGASTVASVADIATHAALATGVHGVGASTVASVADIATHTALPDAHHAGFIGLTIAGPANIDPDAGDRITIEDTASITWASSGAGKIAATAVGGGGYTDEEAQDAVGTILVDTATINFTYDDATPKITADVIPGGIDHGGLAGLGHDDHSIYALLAGRAGGQTLYGGTAASEALTLVSTAHATKGSVILGSTSLFELTLAGQLKLPVTGSAGGLLVGGDCNLYRSAADLLRTDDIFQATQLQTGSTTGMKVCAYGTIYGLGIQASLFEFISADANADFRWGYGASGALTEVMFLDSGVGQLRLPVAGATAGILLGGDANLYRSAADVLKTDDSLIVGADLTVVGKATAVAKDTLWDAAGDLVVGTGADTAARLAKGADGRVLTMVAGAVAWAAPAGGGAVAIYEGGVEKVAAASVIDFNAGFDVADAGGGHADIALDLTEAVWTFAQGGFYFRDASGPLLYTGASGDDLFLTGDLDVSGHMALGATAALSLVNILTVNETISGGSQQHGIRLDVVGNATVFVIGGRFSVSGNAATAGQYVRGIYGGASLVGTGGSGVAEGLVFAATADAGSATVSRLTSMLVWPASTDTHSGAITVAEGIRIGAGGSWAGAKPTTVRGIYILAGLSDAAVGTAYGLLMENLAGTTVRLLELGPATPYLRLVGGAAPAANCTNLYLAEGVVPTLRQVAWKLKSALVDADKVMVLV